MTPSNMWWTTPSTAYSRSALQGMPPFAHEVNKPGIDSDLDITTRSGWFPPHHSTPGMGSSSRLYLGQAGAA